MSGKHTPGPWRVEEDTTLIWGRCTFFDDGNLNHLGIPVAEAHINVGGSSYFTRTADYDTAYANARLIAAAPELLEACIALQMEARARGCGLRIVDEAIRAALTNQQKEGG